MAADLHAIVQRMVEAGESEDAIASVIQQFKAQTPDETAGLGAALQPAEVGGALKAVGSVPSLVQSAAGVAAEHPRAVQQAARAGGKVLGGIAGTVVGSTPGAIVGTLAGDAVVPTQAGIRETMGRLAGEAPDVAQAAGRAQAVINYGRQQGIKLGTGDLIPSTASPSLDAYAQSAGQKVLRLFGPNGEQVVGPGMRAAAEAAPSVLRKTLTGSLRLLPAVGAAGDVLMAAQAFTAGLNASPGGEIRNVMAGQYGLPQSAANTIPGPSMASVASDAFSRMSAAVRQAILDRLSPGATPK
jgi:hypothetical protein